MSGDQESGAENGSGPVRGSSDEIREELQQPPAGATQHDESTRSQLAHFADVANKTLNTSRYKAEEAVDYARRCGEALNGAKKLLAHGEFSPWLEKHFDGSARTARSYMFLATNWQSIADLNPDSMAEALAHIRCLNIPSEEPKQESGSTATAPPPEPAEAPTLEIHWQGALLPDVLGCPGEPALAVKPIRPGRESVDKAAAVIVLLKKHLKAGPTEAVREELRKVQEFCRQELSKFGSSPDLDPEGPSLPGSF